MRNKKPSPRLSLPALRVLQAFVTADGDELAGSDMLAEIKSGTLYPILDRMERAGWLRSRWEDIDPRKAGRPKRRYYRLTTAGLIAAKQVFAGLGLRPCVSKGAS